MTREWASRIVVVASLLLLGVIAARALAGSPIDDPAERARLARVAADVQAAEDISAIKRLQRSYGYYVDKGMWTDVAELFADDAVANYPNGVFIGKSSIREHLFRNVGNVPMGTNGLGDNRLYNHLILQPVIHLADHDTAKGRWRTLAMFGSLGGSATWAEGVYEMQYRKESGVWRIARLDYYPGFGASYAAGWVAPPAASATAAPEPKRREMAHAPDREPDRSCGGFPAACLAPFHYANPGTAAGARAWVTPEQPAGFSGSDQSIREVTADLARRAQRLRDEQAIEDLQRIYGYYIDRGQWDQAADLFSSNATIEYAQRGVFVGRKRVRDFLGSMGPAGGEPGWMNEHMQLQVLVTVAADGRSAAARAREWAMTGHLGGASEWSEGIFENRFVREEGRWKFASVHYYPTFQTDYDAGWGKQARPADGIDAKLPPDRPPTEVYAIYPKAHVPPYHYRNPVSGHPPAYPAVGGPEAALAARALFAPTKAAAAPEKGSLEKVLAQAEHDVARVRDYDEIENLESAYGYYLDKNLYTDLANLFSRDSSMELAMRGVYKGERVRTFLLQVFGRGGEGPVAGRLGNHIQLQPVINVAEDGSGAKARVRMLQQMSMGTRASIGGAIYENEFVREDGIWKFSKLNAYNTLSAGYEGGWARSAGRGMPGPSREFPPDGPPTRDVYMFPVVYEMPYHYANPVSGRTELVPPPAVAEQLKRYPMPAAPAGPGTATGQ